MINTIFLVIFLTYAGLTWVAWIFKPLFVPPKPKPIWELTWDKSYDEPTIYQKVGTHEQNLAWTRDMIAAGLDANGHPNGRPLELKTFYSKKLIDAVYPVLEGLKAQDQGYYHTVIQSNLGR
jgi:hypothetical protein